MLKAVVWQHTHELCQLGVKKGVGGGQGGVEGLSENTRKGLCRMGMIQEKLMLRASFARAVSHLLYAVSRCTQPLSETSLPQFAPCHKPVKIFLCLKRYLQNQRSLSNHH